MIHFDTLLTSTKKHLGLNPPDLPHPSSTSTQEKSTHLIKVILFSFNALFRNVKIWQCFKSTKTPWIQSEVLRFSGEMADMILTSLVGGWTKWFKPPNWNICSAKWESSPNRGEHNIYLIVFETRSQPHQHYHHHHQTSLFGPSAPLLPSWFVWCSFAICKLGASTWNFNSLNKHHFIPLASECENKQGKPPKKGCTIRVTINIWICWWWQERKHLYPKINWFGAPKNAVLLRPQVTSPEIIATSWQNPCIELFKHPMPL